MSHHILAVEDDEQVQSFLKLHLENEGYEVTCAATGKAMIDALSIKKIDLVILDLGLPDEDGLSLTQRVRQRSSVPIVIATARDDQDARLTAFELGADDYLTKPYDPKELLLRVRNILGRVAAEPAGEDKASRDAATMKPARNRPARTLTIGGAVIAAAVLVAVIIDRQQADYSGRLLDLIFNAPEPQKTKPVAAVATPPPPSGNNRQGESRQGAVQPQPKPAPEQKVAPTADIPGKTPKPFTGKSNQTAKQEPKVQVEPGPPKHFSEVLGYGWILKSECESSPKVDWWLNKTNMAIAGYVQKKYLGNWKRYIDVWNRRLANLQRIQNSGNKAILPNGNPISGKQLIDYVKKMEKRVAVIQCLSKEASAARRSSIGR